MNKYTKLFALLGTAFLLGSCQEDSLLQSEGPLSGNEIRFGATAHFKNGNSSTTRTEYGDIEKDENGEGFIEVRWSNGDRIDIACPSTAGTNCAEYVVSGFDHGADENAQNSTATTLTKTGDTGLQWGSSEDNYTFYSVYPSLNTIKSHLQGVTELDNLGVSKEGKLGGYLAQIQDAAPASVDNARKNPTTQNPTTQEDDKTDEVKTGYVIKPNMDFAYMVAKTPNVGYGNDVSLRFESIVTALEFQIFAPDVVGGEVGEITVTGFALSDPDNGDICGPFSYDYNTEKYATPDNGAASGHGLVQMNILGTDGEGVTITKNQYVDVTFFLLPRADEQTYKALDLTVFYKVGNASQVKTATLNRAIAPRTKTYIKNIKLPKITNINASSWWSAIPPATLFSQVSIPVAGNVFATPAHISNEYRQEQTLSIADLWKMGVRGFELCCQTTCDKNLGQSPTQMVQESLGSEAIVVAEEFTDITFGSAVQELITLHSQSGYENEPLILLCTYASKDDGYNPYSYTANLMNYFAGLSEDVRNKMVQITSNTTAADLRGGIAVIVRPGNDLRWAYETQNYTAGTGNSYKVLTNPYTIFDNITTYPQEGLTAKIPSHLKGNQDFPDAGKDMLDKVMFIADWGNSSYDMWNRRYGNQYAMEATSYDKLDATRKSHIHTIYNNGNELLKVENFLLGSQRNHNNTYAWSGNIEDNNFDYYGQGYTAPWNTTIPEFNFEHKLNTSETDKAFVQEWQRVVKEDINETKIASGGIWYVFDDTYYSIWTRWKASLDEKKEAIKDLFNKSVMTKGGTSTNNLYINVLSGYYATTKHTASITPIIEDVSTSQGNSDKLTAQGKGGDYRGLAADLNEYVYRLLTETPNGNDDSKDRLKQQGPWGLVVMDHIGTDGDNGYSTKLVDLIMMNNFRFPLAVGSYDGQGGTGSGPGGSGL